MIGMGRDGFVVTPWQGDRGVAYLRARGPNTTIDAVGLSRCLERLRSSGYEAAVTPALHPEEAGPYFANGFYEFDSLIVLGHALEAVPQPVRPPEARVRIDRARRRDLRRIFEVDRLAFPPQWRMDRVGLREARRATTHVHFRSARDHSTEDRSDRTLIGYAISGRTGSTAFLQRLAIHPDHSGRGTGSALVIDGLRWAADNRCSNLLVNTQVTNQRALSLYERLGFVRSTTTLVVLRCTL